jgi:hypothetical protein
VLPDTSSPPLATGQSMCADCDSCPAGARQACGGSAEGCCSDCIPGKYADIAASPCTRCPTGRYQMGTNEATCNRSVGKFQSLAGQPFCESVEEGLFVSSEPAQVVNSTISLPNQDSVYRISRVWLNPTFRTGFSDKKNETP